jgi:AmmeMemoRadiSam system protein A
MELTADQRRFLLDVARQTIRAALSAPGGVAASAASPAQASGTDTTSPATGDPVLPQRAGCFVSLHTLHTHRLRGCVGRLDCRDELIVAVRQSAINVLHDPRFVDYPVTLEELPRLEIELTVIFPMQEAEHCLDFQPQEDGIFLTIGDRGGCFLPQVARETGWSREQLLARLCSEKLGLHPDAWRHDKSARLHKFKTLVIGPEPFCPPTATSESAAANESANPGTSTSAKEIPAHRC